MANGAAPYKDFIVQSIRSGGWGLYEIKRSMRFPVAVFGQSDNDLADRICFFLNTKLSEEDLIDTDPKDASDTAEKPLNVDQFLHVLAARG